MVNKEWYILVNFSIYIAMLVVKSMRENMTFLEETQKAVEGGVGIKQRM